MAEPQPQRLALDARGGPRRVRVRDQAKGADAFVRRCAWLRESFTSAAAINAGICSTELTDAIGAVTPGCWRSHASATVAGSMPSPSATPTTASITSNPALVV